jgi:hypothetical protein
MQIKVDYKDKYFIARPHYNWFKMNMQLPTFKRKELYHIISCATDESIQQS